jgi:iron-sulfur cluster repair protein YtfE (RIC family)
MRLPRWQESGGQGVGGARVLGVEAAQPLQVVGGGETGECGEVVIEVRLVIIVGLLRHLRIEEELLFPVFEARSGMLNGPTDVMRDEHRQVRMALALMRRGLQQTDTATYLDGLRFFASVLPDHNAKEEHILYPTLDSLLRPSERAALVSRLQREPVR